MSKNIYLFLRTEALLKKIVFASQWSCAGLFVAPIVVGGRHFLLFVLAGRPPFILYTYLIYQLCTLCIYTTIHIFGGLPATPKTRPPTPMLEPHIVLLFSIWNKMFFGHFAPEKIFLDHRNNLFSGWPNDISAIKEAYVTCMVHA